MHILYIKIAMQSFERNTSNHYTMMSEDLFIKWYSKTVQKFNNIILYFCTLSFTCLLFPHIYVVITLTIFLTIFFICIYKYIYSMYKIKSDKVNVFIMYLC